LTVMWINVEPLWERQRMKTISNSWPIQFF